MIRPSQVEYSPNILLQLGGLQRKLGGFLLDVGTASV